MLRRKVEDLERENERNKRQIQDLHNKHAENEKSNEKSSKIKSFKAADGNDPLKEKKIKVMEDEINELRKKIIEKDRDFERTQAETSLLKGKSKTGILKSKYDIFTSYNLTFLFKISLDLWKIPCLKCKMLT